MVLQNEGADGSEEEPETPALTLPASMACLLIITLIVTACSGDLTTAAACSGFVSMAFSGGWQPVCALLCLPLIFDYLRHMVK